MMRAALALALTCTAAEAQHNRPRMALEPGDAACFAFISIVNRAGTYNETERLATIRGEVALAYRTIGGHMAGNAATADQVAVVALPDGVLAVPMQMDILDGDTGRICLADYLGG